MSPYEDDPQGYPTIRPESRTLVGFGRSARRLKALLGRNEAARAGTDQSPWIKQLVDSPSVSKHEWTISFSGLRVVHSEGDENMKTLMIAAAAFATLIVTSVTDADARPGFRGGGYRGGGYRGVAVGRGYRGGIGRPGWGAAGPIAGRPGWGGAGRPGWGAAGPIAGRPGWGRYGYRPYGGYRGYGYGYRRYGYGLAAAGVAAGVGAAYYGGCGPYAYYDSYYGACRYY